MTGVKPFLRDHPVSAYYILTFAISWGGILLVIGGLKGVPGDPAKFEKMLPLVSLSLLAGPTISGLLLTGLVGGRAGFRELFSRMFRWRIGARWYAVALLTAPLLMTAIPVAISLVYPEFLPGIFVKDNKASILMMGISFGLGAGIFEELGWTGFAIPKLRPRHSLLAVGLITGFLWGAWHLLVNLWSSGTPAGELSPTLFLHSFLFSAGILPAFRILMVWVYDRTGSLLLAVLMHMSLTGGNVILVPAATGMTLVAWSLVIAAAMWTAVAVVALSKGRPLSRRPLPGQTA